jgi:structural hemagglutinin/hemolysin toxin protein RtxA
MYQIIFYVPESHTEQVKNAMFANGAGKIGEYSSCAWQVLGEGQFIPLAGSHAFIGEKDKLEKVAEYKVEMICDEKYIKAVVAAMKSAHPYEQPAYFITKTETI